MLDQERREVLKRAREERRDIGMRGQLRVLVGAEVKLGWMKGVVFFRPRRKVVKMRVRLPAWRAKGQVDPRLQFPKNEEERERK